MQIHQLKRNTPNRKSRQVGRGGKRGKTSGRGTKGQKARAGNKLRPEIRDMIKKIPKKRGYGKNRARTVNSSIVKNSPVNISALEKVFSNGDVVTPALLIEKGVLKKLKGRIPRIKILAMGDVTKKLTLKGFIVSKKAVEKIQKAGGTVEVDD